MKARRLYAVRLTEIMCSVLVDIETGYEGEDSWRHHKGILQRLHERRMVDVGGAVLTAVGRDAVALARHYVPREARGRAAASVALRGAA